MTPRKVSFPGRLLQALAVVITTVALVAAVSCGEDRPPRIPGSIGGGGGGGGGGTTGTGTGTGTSGGSGGSLDGGGLTCNNNCDCPQGQRCASGVCSNTSVPTYCCSKAGCPTGSPCVDVNGAQTVCGGTGPIIPCLNHCGCPQGQTCTASQCRTAATPTYCCDKAGCPSGATCVSTNNAPGKCP